MYRPCPCGKQLRVSESHVGRTVRCPGCGTPHVVKADRTAAVPSRQDTTAPPPMVLPVLLRIAAILLLVAGVGLAGWWLLGLGTSGGDEEGLYADAELIAILRPAELWAVPEVREAVGEGRDNPVTQFEGWTSLRPQQVERFTLVAYRPTEQLVWGVVHTVEPYDPALLNRNPVVDHGIFARQPYVVIQTPDRGKLALALVAPRVLILGDVESVKTALGLRARRAAPGPLTPLPAMAKGHQVAVGINLSEEWRGRIMAQDARLGAIPGVRGGVMLLDIAARTTLTVQVDLPDGEERAKLRAALEGAKVLIPLGGLVRDPLFELLASGNIEEDGNTVRLRTEGETGPIVRGLLEWAKKAEP
jgi:hypothetical protein